MYELNENSQNKIKSMIENRNLSEALNIANNFRMPIDEHLTGYSLLAFLKFIQGNGRNWDMRCYPDKEEWELINKIKEANISFFNS